MKAHKPFFLLAGLVIASLLGTAAGYAQQLSGSWSAQATDKAGKVQLTFVRDHSTHSSEWSMAELKGFDFASSGRRDVQFAIDRDAGRVEAEGSASASTAAGGFRFVPASSYAGEMRKLGLGEFSPDAQISFALLDVSLSFARDMAALKLSNLSADKLLAMRIHGVDAAYVKDLRAAGARADDADQLIAFRIHKVTPALVAAMRGGGGVPDDSHLVALAIHGATPDWAADLGRLGYLKIAGADQLIAFRIHGVTPDYIEGVEKQGYDHPAPDQLIAMKIHGVTPDYIASVKAKGVKDVSLDQLMAMKIHGID